MKLGELLPCGGGDTIVLTQPKLLVGRRSHCDICLKFSNVSSHHCELELKDGYWHIRDLGSSNGIKVNGLRVDSKCIMPGDEIMISKHAFNIHYDVADGADAPEDENPFALSLMEKAGLQIDRPNRSEKASNSSSSKSARRNNSKDDFLMEWLNEE